MSKRIETISDVDWNLFLEQEQNQQIVTIAHNPCLGAILSKTFGYEHKNIGLRNGTEILGLMPMVLFRKKVISMPHFSYGGPIMKHKLPQNIQEFIGQESYEVRSFTKLSEHVYDKKVSCILEINPTVDEQLMSLKSKLRQKIRKAEKKGYITRHGGAELLEDFYTLYAQKMLRFGSPPLGKVFFKNLLASYKYGVAVVTVAYDGKTPIGVAFSLSYLGFFEVCWSATDSRYDVHNLHALVCWELLKTTVDKKYSYFSFGRSTINSNNHRFKKQWNPTELPVFYNYSEPVGKSIKELTFLTKIWKLQPLKTSVYFGHLISKYVY